MQIRYTYSINEKCQRPSIFFNDMLSLLRTEHENENSLQFKLGKKQPVFQKHLGWQLKTELNDIF